MPLHLTSSIFLPRIADGQTIGVMAPSSAIVPERFDAGLSILKQRGFHVVIHPQTYLGVETGNQLCGSPAQKAAAFMELWTDPKIDAVIAAGGGNFASQFLHLLDFEHMSCTPKPLSGYSDTTALLTALYAKTHIGGFFGPTIQNLSHNGHLDQVFALYAAADSIRIPLTGAKIITSARQCPPAPVFAATLSVLLSLAGTPYFPDLSGHILILEDIGDELSRIDRALWQLAQIVPFSALAGLIFGQFLNMTDTGRPLGFNWDGIIRKHTHELNCPILTNAPIGHGRDLFPVPLGRFASIDFGLDSRTPDLIFQAISYKPTTL